MKTFFVGAALFVLAALTWIVVNPFNGFGASCAGLTTYDLMPIPLVDFQVRADGAFTRVGKTVDLTMKDVEPLLAPRPDALIIATGWKGDLTPRPDIAAVLQAYNVQILKTGDALDLYNKLTAEGKRVAIHVHST